MLVIAIVFISWAVVHSVLASLTVKAWAVKWLGQGIQRYYRLFFVLFASVTLMPLLFLYFVTPDNVLYRLAAPWRWLMMVGQGLSILLLVIATWQSGLFQFIGVSQLLADPQHFTGNLVTSGIFQYVRHPLYLFTMLFMWLSPTMTRNQLVMYALMSLYFVIGSIHEEQILANEFGEAYLLYKKQVPSFIPVPGRRYQGERTEKT